MPNRSEVTPLVYDSIRLTPKIRLERLRLAAIGKVRNLRLAVASSRHLADAWSSMSFKANDLIKILTIFDRKNKIIRLLRDYEACNHDPRRFIRVFQRALKPKALASFRPSG